MLKIQPFEPGSSFAVNHLHCYLSAPLGEPLNQEYHFHPKSGYRTRRLAANLYTTVRSFVGSSVQSQGFNRFGLTVEAANSDTPGRVIVWSHPESVISIDPLTAPPPSAILWGEITSARRSQALADVVVDRIPQKTLEDTLHKLENGGSYLQRQELHHAWELTAGTIRIPLQTRHAPTIKHEVKTVGAAIGWCQRHFRFVLHNLKRQAMSWDERWRELEQHGRFERAYSPPPAQGIKRVAPETQTTT